MKRILKEGPIFGLMLGLCSSLAITTTLENAIIMGLSVTLILALSNMIISLLRSIIPKTIMIPAYILIISTLVTTLDITLKNNLPSISSSFGIYIPLIIVNCIVLGRAINYASKNKVLPSIKDGLQMGLSYTLSLMLISFIREVLGTGTITIIDKLSSILGFKLIIKFPNIVLLNNPIFVSSAGAFLTLGLLMAFLNRGGNNEIN